MSSPISRSASVTPKVDNISGSWFTENFNDFSDEFLDGLGDMKYYDFGLEDVEPNDAGEDWKNEFQNIEPPPFSFLAGSPSSGFENGKNDLKVEKNSVVSCDVTLQLKQWPATEDLCRKYPSLHDSSDGKYLHSLRTCSPVSVLESSSTSSSSSAEILMTCFPKNGVPVKRPRSKLFYTPRHTFPTIAVPNSSRRHRCWTTSELDGFYAGDMAFDAAKKSHKKKKNLTQISSVMEIIEPCSDSGETRRCTHCQVSKTPQWREGPMGPKTLCNACGVRYRSGRLLPEYRPAASPTFVPSVHSNSHRKVLEMRKKSGRPSASAVMVSPAASAAEYSF